jgi:hypothetical protein
MTGDSKTALDVQPLSVINGYDVKDGYGGYGRPFI